MRSVFRWTPALLVVGFSSVHSLGSTYRHDVGLDPHIGHGDLKKLVGGVTVDLTSFGTGTVIAPQWVLTAAHVVAGVTENSNVRFETDPDPNDTDELPLSGLFGVTEIYIHEYYNDAMGPQGGFDIALLKLDAEITHTPSYNRFRPVSGPTPELGRVGTHVGFGVFGDGNTGFIEQSGGFFRLAGDNTIDGTANDPRMVDENGKFLFFERNVIDPVSGLPVHFTAAQIASQFLLADFDDPGTQPDDPSTLIDESHVNDGLNALGSDVPLALESLVAPGDSGGPMLFDENGNLVVAGINSFIHAFEPPDGDRQYTTEDPGGMNSDNASYSDVGGYLRVSMFNDWIDNIVGPTNIPEPSAGLIPVLIGSAMLRRQRRS